MLEKDSLNFCGGPWRSWMPGLPRCRKSRATIPMMRESRKCWRTRRAVAGQLSLFSSALCRANAEAAASGGASAYALAQWINPNNHALDGGRASSAMEKEAVRRWRKCLGGTSMLDT